MPDDQPAHTLGVRASPGSQRHPFVIGTYEQLGPGESMRMTVDHDRLPLRTQMGRGSGDDRSWVHVKHGPPVRHVAVQRLPDD